MKPKPNLPLCLTWGIIFLWSFSTKSYSQPQPQPVADAFVILDSTGINTVSCRYVIVLEDTQNVEQLEIRLAKSAPDTVALLFHQMDFDPSGGLPSGWFYARSGNRITLETGELSQHHVYFGTVRIKSGGSWSAPWNFISQLTF